MATGDPYPTDLSIADDRHLCIVWNDGLAQKITIAELRDRCPCATCREKRNAEPPPPTSLTVLAPEEARPLSISSMRPVGNYAYNVAFSDGHNTGIYTFVFLRSFAAAEETT